MVRTHTLMESVSASLQEFLREGLLGLLWAGCPVVTRMARKLPSCREKFLSRLDSLETNLNRESDLESKIKSAMPDLWLPLTSEATPIILDLSDFAKPLVKKMDYLAMVRDGSTGKLVNGYWLIEMYASVWPKNPVPILLEPFSHEQPFS